MKLIDASEFRSMLLTPSRDIDNVVLTEDVVIDYPISNAVHAITISNCIFKNLFLKINVNQITIKRSKFNDVRIIPSRKVDRIELENCTSENLLIQGDEQYLISTLSIHGADTNFKSLDVRGQYHTIKVVDEVSSSKCSIVVESCNQLQVKGIKKICEFYLVGSVSEELEISNSSNINISLTGSKIDGLIVSECNACIFDFEHCEIKYQSFSDCSCDIHFNDHKGGTMELYSGNYNKLTFSGKCNIELDVPNDYSGDRRILIEDLNFINVKFLASCSLNFQTTSITNLNWLLLDNFGTIQINNSSIINTFSIVESNLRKTVFNNVVLNAKCKAALIDNDITDTIFNSFKWNNNYKLFEKFNTGLEEGLHGQYETDIEFFISLRESYRQLKSNHLKHNNKIIALEFQKHELRLHALVVRKQLKIYNKNPEHSFFNEFGNYLILWSHQKASDFGQNIWRPLLFLFIFHLAIFNFLLLFTPELNIVAFCNVSTEATLDAISKYFYTIIPTHSFNVPKFDSIDKIQVFIGGFWDFLMRLSSAYFIFYFVAATRKYHQ